MGEEGFIFDKIGVRRIVAAVRLVEKKLTDLRQPRRSGGKGGAERQGSAFAVLVTMDGGDVGSDTDECTYTYTVKALDDSTALRKNNAGDNATGMTPEVPRLHYVGYWYAGQTRTAPAVATSRYGLACYDADGDLHLLICYGEIASLEFGDFECPA